MAKQKLECRMALSICLFIMRTVKLCQTLIEHNKNSNEFLIVTKVNGLYFQCHKEYIEECTFSEEDICHTEQPDLQTDLRGCHFVEHPKCQLKKASVCDGFTPGAAGEHPHQLLKPHCYEVEKEVCKTIKEKVQLFPKTSIRVNYVFFVLSIQ